MNRTKIMRTAVRIVGTVLVLQGVLGFLTASAMRPIFADNANQRFVSFLYDRKLTGDNRANGRPVWVDENGTKFLSFGGETGIQFFHAMAPEDRAFYINQAKQDPQSWVIEKGNYTIGGYGISEGQASLLETFDPDNCPVSLKALRSITYREIYDTYDWGTRLSSHHPGSSFLVTTWGLIRIAVCYPIVPLIVLASSTMPSSMLVLSFLGVIVLLAGTGTKSKTG